MKAAVGSGIIPDEVAAAAISARSKPNQEAPKRGDERHAEAGDEPQENTMDMKFAIYWTGLFIGCVITVFAFLSAKNLIGKALWYHIRFWFTFRSWPTSDKRLMELQKNQYVLERLRSDALALHKANELQAQVLDTIKRGGLTYKEATKELANVEHEQKRRLDRFDRARTIAKQCGFDVSAYFHDYLPKVTKEQDRPAIGGVSGG